MAVFGHEPAAGEKWDVRFVSGDVAYPLREDVTVKLDFLAASAAERPIVYYAGDERCFGGIPGLRAQAEADGWKLIPCTNAAELAANVAKADSYMLQIPHAIVLSTFRAFFRRNVRQYAGSGERTANFVGSIAYYFRPVLEEAAREEGFAVGKILKSPMEGLVKFHS